jgi:hypothetical protein
MKRLLISVIFHLDFFIDLYIYFEILFTLFRLMTAIPNLL